MYVYIYIHIHIYIYVCMYVYLNEEKTIYTDTHIRIWLT